MKKLSQQQALAAGVVAILCCSPAKAIDITSGDWKFSLNGNVNVHYIFTQCEGEGSAKAVAGGLACTGTKSGSSVSNISNGLLPAAFSFGVATTQKGFDIAAHLGLYPGVSTNDGGSPNLQQGGGAINTGLGTTGLDVRQVYMTVGNKDIGTFTLGRNFGLFGFDAIINDMTIPGVGAPGGAASAAPANTTLGSIGLGYIYTDTYAQINYTTPDIAGANFTIGIFQPLNEIGPANPQPKAAPGFHGKATYTMTFSPDTKLYLSSSFLEQKQKYLLAGETTTVPVSYVGYGIDVAIKLDVGPFQALLSPYYAKGLGTTALFLNSDDGAGNRRRSDGLLAQATYKISDIKLGINYGISRLGQAKGETNPTLVKRNSKITGGVYYSLTKNLTLVSEITDVRAKAQDNDHNNSIGGNVGAFLSF